MEYEDHFGDEFSEEEELFDNDDKSDKSGDENLKLSKEEDNILKSVWEKSDNIKIKQKRSAPSRPRPKFNERELISNRGLPALKLLFDNYKINDNVGPYENLNQILSKMEYWAHGFFPQLNFEDFVEKAENLGHKRIVRLTIDRMRNGVDLNDNVNISEDEEKNDENSKKEKPDEEKTAEELFDEQFVDNFYDEDELLVNTDEI